MPDGDLRQLAEVEEISIGVMRPDGSVGSTPVWVVQAGDAIVVRSIRGRRGGWYRRLGANPDGQVGDRAHPHPVRARPVQDADTVEAVTGAYSAKTATAPTWAAADRGGGRGDAGAGASAVATVAAGRRSTALSQRLQPAPGRAGAG